MSKNLKEFMLRQTTGQVDLEFDDDSTQSYNMKDVVSAITDPVTGVISLSAGAASVQIASPSLNVANRGECLSAQTSVTSPKTRVITRRKYVARLSSDVLSLVFQNKTVNTSGEPNGPAGVVIAGCAIEFNGVSYKVQFAGSDSVTMAAGDVSVVSDAVKVNISKGDVFYVRSMADCAVSGAYCTDGVSISDDASYVYNPVNENSQLYSAGALTSPTGASVTTPFAPCLVIGRPAAGSVAVIGVGDSIAQGFHDIPGDGNGNGGLFRRFGSVAQVPICSYAIPGKTLQSVVNASAAMQALAKYHTHAIVQLGTNDVSGANIDWMKYLYQTVWLTLKTSMSGKKYVAQTTLLPRVSSTDGVTSLVNQTPTAGFVTSGQAEQLRAWMLAQYNAALIDGICDLQASVCDKTDYTKWATRSFSTTLSSAYSSGTTLSIGAHPRIGELLVVSPSSSPSSGTAVVKSVSGTTAPFSATLLAAPGGSFASGTSVAATPTIDGVHPSAVLYETALVPALVAAVPLR